ncbi:helix-turn-helix transcriptional regulator [Streptomyces sp. Cmuel-A718b]|uniref:helix-turn-helix domain-containing protein n=1 Tax=Streptomyces sp. Cmuel-A718b TaxID=697328 RepID=UPI00081E9EB0|nr:helix-turn-helix transcriptional regulator [Streptomyces sp. Cmuel-A718b]SCF59023.1 DNA-binding transcriptional regulator, XRE-family HTH domain [Streptomyces sp. Cmuel-A718b]
MPARHFDRTVVRAVRRAAEIPQAEVGAAVDAADSTVAGWELGSSVPDQEKLPGIARVLRKPLDELFPRKGTPDLMDLRCDAGLYRYEVARFIGTKSDGPVAAAENGVRRLKEKYVPKLAAAYGVSERVLEQAQERSFGNTVEEAGDESVAGAEAGESPRTLGEKISFLLEQSYPAGAAPGDEEIAEAVNRHAGSEVVTANEVEALRTGTGEADSPPPVVLEGLAEFFGVERMYFEPDDAVARQVYQGIRVLLASKNGGIRRVRARGLGPEGLSPEVLSLLTDLETEFEKQVGSEDAE